MSESQCVCVCVLAPPMGCESAARVLRCVARWSATDRAALDGALCVQASGSAAVMSSPSVPASSTACRLHSGEAQRRHGAQCVRLVELTSGLELVSGATATGCHSPLHCQGCVGLVVRSDWEECGSAAELCDVRPAR